jgi:predicted nucleotide-binding protein (sugar kinase/HSP70/actin superfamily)
MYATEYRKALRDPASTAFGSCSSSNKADWRRPRAKSGLEFTPKFFIGLLLALMAGDVLNGMGYRIRPFEVEPGSTDRALAKAREHVQNALAKRTFLPLALWKARKELASMKCDFTRPAPRVSIIGEFWAMTTEGDGNYKLQRFLEQEGAECDVQLVTNWILYNIWEARYDARSRAYLRGQDQAKASLKAKAERVELHRATWSWRTRRLRLVFQTFARLTGFPATTCPTWTKSPASRTSTTTIVCAAAKATWRWASSFSTCFTTSRT